MGKSDIKLNIELYNLLDEILKRRLKPRRYSMFHGVYACIINQIAQDQEIAHREEVSEKRLWIIYGHMQEACSRERNKQQP